mmetsp:Transcript_16512/g.48285  ORF Transcript_16512/g.48285 Transcript_16512/m.48285 type:complete len:269 (-) Transcript_16512:5-811(-)
MALNFKRYKRKIAPTLPSRSFDETPRDRARLISAHALLTSFSSSSRVISWQHFFTRAFCWLSPRMTKSLPKLASSPNRRNNRSEKPWNVRTSTPPQFNPRSLSNNSRAALFEKVSTSTEAGRAPSATARATRRVNVSVLPEPAPATIASGSVNGASTAACCSAVSGREAARFGVGACAPADRGRPGGGAGGVTTRRGGASDDVVLRGTWNFLRRGGIVPPSPSQASRKSQKPPRRTEAPRAAELAAINVLLLQRRCLTPREYLGQATD